MCGRFVLLDLKEHFKIDHSFITVSPNYNVAPSQLIPAIIREDDKNNLVGFHWGLVPFWAKDKSIGNRLINARMETVSGKPAFRAAFKKRRCLVPANGFYEWKDSDGNKQPYYITVVSDEPFAFAGLWEVWDKEDPPYKSCLLITTESSESIQPIHNRMPVILKPDYHDKWINPDSEDPIHILKEGMIKEFKSFPVSRKVNKPEHNAPDCIKPISGGLTVII
jgi:putative SOS response-associated peptidase YedK